MRKHALKLVGLLGVALAVALLVPQRAAADDDDPPGRVGRLGYVHGSVSFEPAGTDDWVSAVVNRPLTTGDKLWTDKGARAELHVGAAAIRLSGETGFSFLELNDRVTQLRLTEGTLNVRVRRMGEDETFEIDAPNLAFSILRPGRYRISVNEAGDTTVIHVRDGEGEVTGGGSAYTIRPNEEGTFTGNDQLDADIENLPGEDDFDNWCNDRDRREDHSVSARYVSNDVIGYQDLDDYGGWRPVPEYGTIWFPHVAVVGWAPYRFGHWCWISPWGWTWVDDAPWGFAPFHYGRWVVVGGAWGWVPCPPRPVVIGVAYVRPVYAPALVAWVGGPHFGVGIGIGGGGFAAGVNVGWFPLGPREVYVPSYPVSRTYVNNVNVTNTTVNNTYVTNVYNTTVINKTTNVTNIKYVNQGVPGAVTATSPTAFTSAKPVGQNMVQVNQREVASAPVAAGAPAVAPPKQAVLGSGAPAAARPPAAVLNRPVVAKTAPPPPPASFERQQAAIKANGGQPIATSQARQLPPERAQATAAPVRIAPPATLATPRVINTPSAGIKPGQTAQASPNRPGASNVGQPSQGTKPGNPQVAPQNQKQYNDRPPTARPSTPANANPQLEQKHQQQLQQLQQKQDQEWQRTQQKQQQEQQKLAQKAADERRQQEAQQKQQQQLQGLQQKHEQQQQKLQQKQQQEHQKQEQERPKQQPKPKEDRPAHH